MTMEGLVSAQCQSNSSHQTKLGTLSYGTWRAVAEKDDGYLLLEIPVAWGEERLAISNSPCLHPILSAAINAAATG